jgi:RNA polymerase sigma factor (sigma-70 family)
MREAEAAYRESLPLLLVMARNAGFNENEQREIAQRVAMVLVEKVDEYDAAKGTRRMWAAGIARNIVLDARRTARTERRRADRSGSLQRIPSPTLTPEETLRARESLTLLREGVREEHRAVLELDAQGCTAPEIGKLLGMTNATVAWRLREARKDLDRTLVTMGEDRKEITRVRSAMFLPAVFEGLWDSAHFSEPANPAEGVAPDAAGGAAAHQVLPAPEGRRSWTRDVRQACWRAARGGVSRVWAAMPSASPFAMAAAVVLAIGSILGIAAAIRGGALRASSFDGAASRSHAHWAVSFFDGGAGGAKPRAVSVGGRAPAPVRKGGRRPVVVPARSPAIVSSRSPAIVSSRGPAQALSRRREWLVIRTLLGLRRDAEAKLASGHGQGEIPCFCGEFSIKGGE